MHKRNQRSPEKREPTELDGIRSGVTFLSFWRIPETADRRETASSRKRITSRVARGTRRRALALSSSSEAAISSDTIWSFISKSTRCLSKDSCGWRDWQAELIHFFGSKFSPEKGPKSRFMAAPTFFRFRDSWKLKADLRSGEGGQVRYTSSTFKLNWRFFSYTPMVIVIIWMEISTWNNYFLFLLIFFLIYGLLKF